MMISDLFTLSTPTALWATMGEPDDNFLCTRNIPMMILKIIHFEISIGIIRIISCGRSCCWSFGSIDHLRIQCMLYYATLHYTEAAVCAFFVCAFFVCAFFHITSIIYKIANIQNSKNINII